MKFKTRIAWMLPVCLGFIIGCGGGDKETTVPVTGTMYVDGKPFGPATLTLRPVDAESGTSETGATVGKDGTFTLTTSKGDEGAAPGKYYVTVSEDVMEAKAVPKLKPATVEIPKGSGEAVTIDIKLTSIKGAGLQAGPGTGEGQKTHPKGPGGI